MKQGKGKSLKIVPLLTIQILFTLHINLLPEARFLFNANLKNFLPFLENHGDKIQNLKIAESV